MVREHQQRTLPGNQVCAIDFETAGEGMHNPRCADVQTTRADHLFIRQDLMRKAARREPADQLQQTATAPDTVEFERSDQVFDISDG
jgi:hypothetical protein